MTINVKMPDGINIVPLLVEGSDTIYNVKGMITNLEHIPRRHQELVFMEQTLDNDHKLKDYSVEDGSVLDLVLFIIKWGSYLVA